jgi:thioredoxin-like negative regulator of GroEL
MGSILDIHAESFEKEVKQANKIVALLFWMRSCDGCRKFKPIYEQLSEILLHVKFVQMNIMKSLDNLRLSESFDVDITPTVKIFCNGYEIGTLVGHRLMEQALVEIQDILTSNFCI